jgi:hypothetical protein
MKESSIVWNFLLVVLYWWSKGFGFWSVVDFRFSDQGSSPVCRNSTNSFPNHSQFPSTSSVDCCLIHFQKGSEVNRLWNLLGRLICVFEVRGALGVAIHCWRWNLGPGTCTPNHQGHCFKGWGSAPDQVQVRCYAGRRGAYLRSSFQAAHCMACIASPFSYESHEITFLSIWFWEA